MRGEERGGGGGGMCFCVRLFDSTSVTAPLDWRARAAAREVRVRESFALRQNRETLLDVARFDWRDLTLSLSLSLS